MTLSFVRSLALAAVSALTLSAASPVLASGDLVRDPSGESANYELDRASNRTSSIVRGGNMTARVVGLIPGSQPPTYEVKIDYTFRIQLLGTRSGSQAMEFDETFFTPEFMDELRVNGEYNGAKFKIRHLGYEDARNLDGRVYRNCDKVLIYDVAEDAGLLADIARNLLGVDPAFHDQLDDMEIRAHVQYGVPVIGAVKLDVKGKYQGQTVKAGADYRAP